MADARLETLEKTVVELQGEVEILSNLSMQLVQAHLALRNRYVDLAETCQLAFGDLRACGILSDSCLRSRWWPATLGMLLEDPEIARGVAAGAGSAETRWLGAASRRCAAGLRRRTPPRCRRGAGAGAPRLLRPLAPKPPRDGGGGPSSERGGAAALQDLCFCRRAVDRLRLLAGAGALCALQAAAPLFCLCIGPAPAGWRRLGGRAGAAAPRRVVSARRPRAVARPAKPAQASAGVCLALLQEIWQYSTLAESLAQALGAVGAERFRAASRTCRECLRSVAQRPPAREAPLGESPAGGVKVFLEEVWHFALLAETLASVMGGAAVRRFRAVSRAGRECMRGCAGALGREGVPELHGERGRHARTAGAAAGPDGRREASGGLQREPRHVIGEGAVAPQASGGPAEPNLSELLCRLDERGEPVPVTVRLRGLTARTELNGKLGRLLSCSSDQSRYLVSLPRGDGLRVRAANLEVVTRFEPLHLLIDVPRGPVQPVPPWAAAPQQALWRQGAAAAVFAFGARTSRDASDVVHLLLPRSLRWHSLPPLARARGHACLATLAGGLYVIGGRDAEGALASAEFFDPALGQWRPCAPMGSHRYFAAAVVLGSCIYVCGGCPRGGACQPTAERFCRRQRYWASLPAMLEARCLARASALGGCVYVCGGCDNWDGIVGSVERFSPKVGVWNGAFQMPQKCLFQAQAVHANCLYICGGSDGALSLADAVRFNHSSGKWEPLPPMGSARCGAAAAATPSGDIVVCGGSENSESIDVCPLSSVECFRRSLGAWEPMDGMASPHSFPGSLVSGGHLYVLGGRDRHGVTAAAERLDLASETWQTLPPMPGELVDCACAALHQGK